MRHGAELDRAPALTPWAAIVAGRLGFEGEEAPAPARAFAKLDACSSRRAEPPDCWRRGERSRLTLKNASVALTLKGQR